MRKATMTAMFLALAPMSGVALTGMTAPAHAQQTEVSVSLFFQQLSPHGRWFEHPRWGWAWFPTAVDSSWRPYSRGHWVWTEEYGWYWVSDETFGWAVYHYGRWAYDDEFGWIWIPGSTWGPSWVAFRYSEGYVGWAPLPPDTLDANYGWNAVYTDMTASYYQPRWLFVPRRHFMAPRVYAYATLPVRNAYFIRQTVNVTNYTAVNRGVFNRSIEPRRIEAGTGTRIRPWRVNVVNDPRRVGERRAQAGTVNVFRPPVRVMRDAAPPEASRARPEDRPRVTIQRNATAPSERRDVRRGAAPDAPKPPTAARPPETPQPPSTATPRQHQPDDNRFRRAAPPDAPKPPVAAKPPETPQPPSTATPRQRQPDDNRFRRAAPPDAPKPPLAARPPETPKPPITATPRSPSPDDPRSRRSQQPDAPKPPVAARPPETAKPPAAQPPSPPKPPARIAQPPAHTPPPPPRAQPVPPAKPQAPPPQQGPCGSPGQPPCPSR